MGQRVQVCQNKDQRASDLLRESINFSSTNFFSRFQRDMKIHFGQNDNGYLVLEGYLNTNVLLDFKQDHHHHVDEFYWPGCWSSS